MNLKFSLGASRVGPCSGACALISLCLACLGAVYLHELEIFRGNAPGALWVNWIGEFSCGPGVAIERPSSVEELEAAVRRYPSVRAAATGHSFNFFACPKSSTTGAAVVDMRNFRAIEILKDEAGAEYAARAEAGLKMGQFQNELLRHGLTLRVPPGNSAYTVGGCIATGCHNLGQSHAQDLLAVTLVMHNGTVREVRRGDPDFAAAAVSVGRLGVILSVTLEVLPYRSLSWEAEMLPMKSTPDVMDILENMTKMQTSRETVGNKLVFYLATGVIMMEHWTPAGRNATVERLAEALTPYVNPQPFRVGQGSASAAGQKLRNACFSLTPQWMLTLLQIPAEAAFRGLHVSPALKKVRLALGWQHSPEARGEGTVRPSGNQYTWAGWIDEVMNLVMGLRHVEVIFPLEPKDRAVKCLDTVFAHRHLAWWRLNVRTQKSESFQLSSTHSPADAKPVTFLRVDFVSPGALLDDPAGEASLTARLHTECPGWRKHWGKGLFATSAEERWGEPEAFLEVVSRWDPKSKFQPAASPSWLLG